MRDYHAKRLAGQAGALELPALLNAFVIVCNAVAYLRTCAASFIAISRARM